MGRTSDSRARMIGAAGTLFQSQGYNGTGLTQILEVGAAPKGSFYHHFPDGKEGLAEAVVRTAGPSITGWVDQAFDDAASFDAGAARLVRSVGDWFERSGWAAGCPVTSVLLDTVPASDRLRSACREAMDGWAEAIARHARRLGAKGDPETLGTAVVVALEGAWVMARARQDRTPFKAAGLIIAHLEGGAAVPPK